MTDRLSPRVRLPLRAKVAIAAAVVFFLGELAAFALWMMPLIPLVPLFVTVMLGNGFVLASIVEWATSLARVEPVKTPRADSAAEAHRPRAARPATAT
jgi:hypothetical protein